MILEHQRAMARGAGQEFEQLWVNSVRADVAAVSIHQFRIVANDATGRSRSSWEDRASSFR